MSSDASGGLTLEVVQALPEDAVRWALWVFGDWDEGVQPPGFIEALYALCSAADGENLDRALGAWPEPVMAWYLAKQGAGTMLRDRLVSIREAREAARERLAAAFGFPIRTGDGSGRGA